MRGLKPPISENVVECEMSHLLQMRGLKLDRIEGIEHDLRSHLLQMRGLKPFLIWMIICLYVASFTDAWIETKGGALSESGLGGRIFYRCVD